MLRKASPGCGHFFSSSNRRDCRLATIWQVLPHRRPTFPRILHGRKSRLGCQSDTASRRGLWGDVPSRVVAIQQVRSPPPTRAWATSIH
jgi:hypothetical protein